MRRENSQTTEPTRSEAAGTTEAGFTLIELMVVLLIIAILLAIAIPTFLGVTNTAGDRAAQSNLTNALTEAKALYEINQAYTGTSGAYSQTQFQSQAPEFSWTSSNCGSSNGNCVSFVVFSASLAGDGQGLGLATYSAKTNTCWYAWDVEEAPSSSVFVGNPTSGTFPSAGTWYGKQVLTGTTKCQALNPTSDGGVKGFATGSTGQAYSNAASVS